MNRGGTPPRIPPAPKAKDAGVGEVALDKDWQVTAAVAEHCQPYLDSLAYRVDAPEGSVIFTGDTQPCDTVRDLARDADMMLCMCWDEQSVMETANEAKGQCGTTQLAQEAGVKKLVLIHMGPSLSRDTPFERHVDEMTHMYDGEIIFSEELMRIEM
jgi:ribonuclease BN (tRNA processing enzyme)